MTCDEMPKSLKVVFKYATDCMTVERTFEVPMPADILGHDHNQIILQEDIIQFGAMIELSATCILGSRGPEKFYETLEYVLTYPEEFQTPKKLKCDPKMKNEADEQIIQESKTR
ncbi:hypothetical protein L484_009233 [Morus notabilis]|uniref:Uncharacterized protein n=1 Tax=Morus notabilis TaxID=981085 RepID=W9RV26_9ROSA|nr:hypothetical protein L484_009233 [Morus notabilis]